MANHHSAQNPYKWPDGTWHSRPYAGGNGVGGGGGGVGPSNSFGYQGSFGNPPPPQGGVGPSNSFGYQGSFGNANHVTPGYTQPAPGVSPGGAGAVGGRPLDPMEGAYRLSAGRQIQLGAGEAIYQRGNLDQEYGYGAGGAANPYSRAALLEEAYKRSQIGTTNNMASAGQLHSGAYGRAQNENTRNYSIGVDRNRRGYDAAVHGINYGQALNTANYGIGVDDESFAALLRSLGGGN